MSVPQGAATRWLVVGLAGTVVTSILFGAVLTLLIVGSPEGRAAPEGAVGEAAGPDEAPPPPTEIAAVDPASASQTVPATEAPLAAEAPGPAAPRIAEPEPAPVASLPPPPSPAVEPAPPAAPDLVAAAPADEEPESAPAPAEAEPADALVMAAAAPSPAPRPAPPATRVAALAAATEPGGYALQVGAFREAGNASDFAAELASAGFAPELVARGPWSIVTVGPYRSAAEASEASGAIRRAFGVSPILRALEAR